MKFNLFKPKERREVYQDNQENYETVPAESMLQSNNDDVRFILRQCSPEKIEDLSDFTNKLANTNLSTNPDLSNYNQEILSTMPYSKTEALKNYTGFGYKYINSVARGFWNYDELGMRTEENYRRINDEMEKVSGAIQSSPNLPTSMRTFRGANLDSFRGYGVSSLEDLAQMKGQLFYERGYTSTSIGKDTSFFDRDFDDTYRKRCDIEIEYLIPGGTNEGIALQDDNLSYSPGQNEYLLDKNSLCRIMDVEVGDGKAKLKMAFIPKRIWAE